MVQRNLKVPKHGGPDGQGLPRAAFEQLLELAVDKNTDDLMMKEAIELCLSASTQVQWNDEYREELIKRME
jgi:hypothetical protein